MGSLLRTIGFVLKMPSELKSDCNFSLGELPKSLGEGALGPRVRLPSHGRPHARCLGGSTERDTFCALLFHDFPPVHGHWECTYRARFLWQGAVPCLSCLPLSLELVVVSQIPLSRYFSFASLPFTVIGNIHVLSNFPFARDGPRLPHSLGVPC